MEQYKRIIQIRESTGMNRKEFCIEYEIPYRTMTEWERNTRQAPEYVVRLLEYYVRMNKISKETKEDGE